MAEKKDLSTLPQFLKPEVAERVAEHFKDGAFEFDLIPGNISPWRATRFTMSFPIMPVTARKACWTSCDG